MKKVFFLMIVLSMICVAHGRLAENKIQVLLVRKYLYVRSYFSQDQDVLILLLPGKANKQICFQRSYLIAADAPMTFASISKNAKLFHGNSDDTAPWRLNDTYIGGSHAYGFGLELKVNNHGLNVADLGTEWLDNKGDKYYIIEVVDSNTLRILSENKSDGDIWKFNRWKRKEKNKTLKNAKGKILKATSFKYKQLYPASRINFQKYLVDGKTALKQFKAIECNFLDVVDNYDIIAPDTMLEFVKKNTGKEVNRVDKSLASIIYNHIIYRFLPLGTCLIKHHAKTKRKFKLRYMGFTQGMAMGTRSREYRGEYIPKTIPFEREGKKYDFTKIEDITSAKGARFYFMPSRNNIKDLNDLPDRFIQLLDNTKDGKKVPKIAYAIGYSRLEGMTKPEIRSKNTSYAFRFIAQRKSYPIAISNKVIKKDTEFNAIAYRQYFDARRFKNATSVYWHKQGDDYYVLYADYHKNVKGDIIKLPNEFTGKKVSIIEKTPSITLDSGDKIPPEGIKLSVKNNYGFIGLKIK